MRQRPVLNTRLNAQILEEAADWLIELNACEPDARVRQNFDAWLRVSPEHVRAYLELLPVWEDGASLPPRSPVSADELIEMGKRPESNVIALEQARPLLSRPTSRSAILLAACVAIFAMCGGLAWLLASRGSYATGIGEQRSIALEDGSTVSLNAHSEVRVQFTSGRRAVELIEGQALFHVAKDASRPFIVSAGNTQVRAVGTQFDVNRRKRGTVVTVVEGTVAVSGGGEPQGTDPSPLVTAGEQVTVSGASVPLAVRANVATATAWTQRRFVFDASTLGEVIEEFNRYNARRLVLRDRALESFPITAAFSSNLM